jgi:RND superfamily putative drug exporter
MAWRLNPRPLARASSRHPWGTLTVWVLLLVVGGGLSSLFLASALTTDIDFTNEPESKRAAELIEDRLRGQELHTELVVVTSDTLTVRDESYRSYVGDLQAAIADLGDRVVRSVGSYLTREGPVSEDGRTALLPVVLFSPDTDDAADEAAKLADAVAAAEAPAGVRTLVAGPATLSNDSNEIVEEDLAKGETIGILAALIILVLVFGAVVAGLVPITVAIVSITVSFGASALVGLAFDLSFLITNIITLIGLAVGIDYSLFIVSRYREERRHGHEKHAAIARAGGTASRAVFFSGLTVVLALLGLVLVPNTVFRSLGIGAIFVVVISVAASLTLLPAMLGLLGDRVNSVRIRRHAGDEAGSRGTFWDRASRGVMRRPVLSLIAAAGILVAASIPYFSIRTGIAGVSTLPDDVQSKQAFMVLADNFSGGQAEPTEIVIDGHIASPKVRAGIEELEASLRGDRAFGPARPLELNDAGDLAVLSVPFRSDPIGGASVEALRRLRGAYVPRAFAGVSAEVLVGGTTAFYADFFDQANSYAPIVFLFVLGLSFLLLTVVFRSLVVPAKAMVMNLLSVGAAYGMIVLFFQQGVGPGFVKDIAAWLNFRQVEAIEAWLPLFLFSILFGLSMDYHVFLLTRIRERFDQTGDNAGSVAHGLRSTGGLITGAALIMVAVFAGFAAGRLVPLQQMGFGLAVAVFLDATIVRSVLVPASMKLLGAWNWYLPRWLQWLPRLNVEGTLPPVEVPEPASPVAASQTTGTTPGGYGELMGERR